MTTGQRRHYHAVNESLSPEDAALCAYETRGQAEGMVGVWVNLAKSYGIRVEAAPHKGWYVYSRDGTERYRVGIRACDDTSCRVRPVERVPSARGAMPGGYRPSGR